MKLIYTWADEDGYTALEHIVYCCKKAKEAKDHSFLRIEMDDRWGARCLILNSFNEEWRTISYCPFCGTKIEKEEDALLNKKIRQLRATAKEIAWLHTLERSKS